MFSKLLNRLFPSSKKDLVPNTDENYIELRDILIETLLPIGFVADEEDVGTGAFVKCQRGSLLVELYFDKRDRLFLFFASKDLQDLPAPPRQVSMTFSSDYNTDEPKIALRAKLEEWLKTLE